MRSFAAFRKKAGLFCESFLRKDEVFAYVGLIQNLKNLKGCVYRYPHEGSFVTGRWSWRVSLVSIFERYVTKFAPHKALKVIP